MIPPASDRSKESDRWSVERYTQWVQQQPFDPSNLFELVEGKVHPLPNSAELMRMIRLLQCQLQHCFSSRFTFDSHHQPSLAVQVRSSLQLDNFNQLQPAILVGEDRTEAVKSIPSVESKPLWIIDIAEGSLNPLLNSPMVSHHERARLYARAGVLDYWWLDLDGVELHVYQQPNESGYQAYKLLQVGEQAAPTTVPLALRVKEPVPIYFMTRTLKGQQAYESSVLPLSIKADRSLAF